VSSAWFCPPRQVLAVSTCSENKPDDLDFQNRASNADWRSPECRKPRVVAPDGRYSILEKRTSAYEIPRSSFLPISHSFANFSST
jgi:hypothetical protein